MTDKKGTGIADPPFATQMGACADLCDGAVRAESLVAMRSRGRAWVGSSRPGRRNRLPQVCATLRPHAANCSARSCCARAMLRWTSCRDISEIFVAVSALACRSLVSRLSNPFMLPTSQLGLRYPLERILPCGLPFGACSRRRPAPRLEWFHFEWQSRFLLHRSNHQRAVV